MLIRKNTKEYKAILQIFQQHLGAPLNNKFFKLFIVKAGEKLSQRIPIESIEENKSFYWTSTLEAILANLQSSNHQLLYDDAADTYYFHSGQNKSWDETPFQIHQSLRKKFLQLAALQPKRIAKQKTKTKPIQANSWHPITNPLATPAVGQPKKEKKTRPAKAETKPKPEKKNVPKFVKPVVKTNRPLDFTNVENMIFPELGLTKGDVFKYYDQTASLLLPNVKNRIIELRWHPDNIHESIYSATLKELQKSWKGKLPSWLASADCYGRKNKGSQCFVCPDKDHLMMLVEIGCVELNVNTNMMKTSNPDMLLISLHPANCTSEQLVETAKIGKQVMEGLKIPARLQTSGEDSLQLQINLSSAADLKLCNDFALMIGKLIHLKAPELTIMQEEGMENGEKVQIGCIQHETVIPVFSLRPNDWAGVVTPLKWEELGSGFEIKDYNYFTVSKRIQKKGDALNNISVLEKVDAVKAFRELNERYGFLV